MVHVTLLIGHFILSTVNVIVIGVSILWLVDFIKRWKEEHVRKRRPRFVILVNICLLCILFQMDPMNLALQVYGNRLTTMIYDAAWMWLIFPMFAIISSALVIRIWLLYFDMQLSHFMKNKKWQMV